MITEERQKKLVAIQRQEHPDCIICGRNGALGLHVDFKAHPDGSVQASFPVNGKLVGYKGLLHGGVISLLLDSAMTNCLFARGISAVTGGLSIRFRRAVTSRRPVDLKAWVKTSHPPLHLLEAELSQDGEVSVRASGRFFERKGTFR